MKVLINTQTKEILKEAKSIGEDWVDTQEWLELLELENPYNEEGSFITLTDSHLAPFLMKTANAEFEQEVAALTVGIPKEEQMTWTKQEQEARAYILDSNASTPFIDAICTARGCEKSYLVNKIIEKADEYAVAVGTLTGIRQKLEKEILGE